VGERQHHASATTSSNRRLNGGVISVTFKKPWRFAATRRNGAAAKNSAAAGRGSETKLPSWQSILYKARTFFENNPAP